MATECSFHFFSAFISPNAREAIKTFAKCAAILIIPVSSLFRGHDGKRGEEGKGKVFLYLQTDYQG